MCAMAHNSSAAEATVQWLRVSSGPHTSSPPSSTVPLLSVSRAHTSTPPSSTIPLLRVSSGPHILAGEKPPAILILTIPPEQGSARWRHPLLHPLPEKHNAVFPLAYKSPPFSVKSVKKFRRTTAGARRPMAAPPLPVKTRVAVCPKPTHPRRGRGMTR